MLLARLTRSWAELLLCGGDGAGGASGLVFADAVGGGGAGGDSGDGAPSPGGTGGAPSATIAITEMAYATGPVSDVTRVVSGPSHGRFVPVSAAKAPLKPTATMNASIRATRRLSMTMFTPQISQHS